ncbi:preprotein translocase subunit SecE [Parachitinimonas caeni]|uniref:Protein translocase subunit SecE n=1 Tax=Parachitinimonas caeni TaxID=3031301 RepID=A0ABT7E213_9NEIS|nr:preprotein translocase subunit SecE [Parachitinimonas caeni]MDK2126341.1 preprotein translocase subunit SecE [Parachitinimonas caeni]
MENLDKLKIVIALLLVVLGVSGYYVMPVGDSMKWVRVFSVVFGVVGGGGVLLFSTPGKEFLVYARESYREAQKVVWPSRKEVWQITGFVFLFVLVLAVFMLTVDKSLEWLLYEQLLGRAR